MEDSFEVVRVEGGDDLFSTCNTPEDRIERADELKRQLLEMWADRAELLDPIWVGGGRVGTTDRAVAERHHMYHQTHFELADGPPPPPDAE